MTKQKQSKSARIRKMLEQGKSVKQIAATVHCTPQQVYQIRSADNKQKQNAAVMTEKANQALIKQSSTAKQPTKEWVFVETSTSKEPIGIPKEVYLDHVPPLDYYQPKRNVVQRFFNWLCGG